MKKTFVSFLTCACSALLLTACGLADVGASAATQGASAAEQAKQARETEAKVQQRLDDAQAAAASARQQADE
jgi:major membrane immunogen (membrane-anchored lipoprotein)